MILRWLSRTLANWRKPRRRPQRPRLGLTLLEGRATPSATAGIFLDDHRDTVFDIIKLRTEVPAPAAHDRWAVSLDRCDRPEDDSFESPLTTSGAALLTLCLGTAAVSPYDREEDARWQPFHGCRV